MKEQIKIEPLPQTVAEAVHILTVENDTKKAIEYLRTHPDDINEFCLQTFESYRAGDNTGITQLGIIIEELLKNNNSDIKSKIEKKANEFRDYIGLNKKVSKKEALDKLSSFHNTNPQNILNAFINLRNVNEEDGDFIIFEESINGGHSCVSMRVYDRNKKFKSSSLINEDTGQPMEHVG